jgi:hypothetical protein
MTSAETALVSAEMPDRTEANPISPWSRFGQKTGKYLGCKQRAADVVNDSIGIEPNS